MDPPDGRLPESLDEGFNRGFSFFFLLLFFQKAKKQTNHIYIIATNGH